MESFKLTYIGGIGRVTGSCTLVDHRGSKFLVDCGMVQGEVHAEHANSQPFPFKPHEIKFIILTHAHLDHCGLIPRLVEKGFVGKIYCTHATKLLTIEILKDAEKLSKCFKKATINKLDFLCIDRRDDFKWGALFPIDNDLRLGVYRSAHILGSVSVSIADVVSRDTVWFSGDVGRNCRSEMLQPLLKYRQGPDKRNILVVCESTYGAKISSQPLRDFDERQKYFQNVLENTLLRKGGDVVIPAFSLQRTQDIMTDLFLLFRKNPELCGGISVVCDSPTARKISKIYAKELFAFEIKNSEKSYKYLNPALLDILSEDSAAVEQLQNIFRSDRTEIGQHSFNWKNPSAEFSDKPTVYISSAGMCSGGPVINHLKRCLPKPNNTVILTGFQASGTIGNKLAGVMNGESVAEKPLDKILEIMPNEIQAEILMMNDYSGHADTEGLLGYLFNEERGFTSPNIHLNHGDDTARESLAISIMNRFDELEKTSPGKFKRPNVCSPQVNSSYVINDGAVEPVKQNEHLPDFTKELLRLLTSVESRLSALEASLNK